MALYNSIAIPLKIAFEEHFFESMGIVVLDSFIDLVFFIDLFVNMRTTYYDAETGEEVDDPKLLAKEYLKECIFDVLSAIPFDKFSDNDFLPFFGMLKLMRVFRISMVIRNLNITKTSKSLLKVLWLIMQLFLILHIVACLWYYTVRDSEKWVVNCDYVLGGT